MVELTKHLLPFDAASKGVRPPPFCIALLGFLLLASIGCVQRPDGAANSRKGEKVLNFDIPASFGSLDPREDQVSGTGIVYRFLYAYLFGLTADGNLEPDLALSWTYTRETRTWTVTIRKDAFFHSGRPVTVEDVHYSMLEITKSATPNIFAEEIRSISILAEDRLEIVLKQDDDAFLKKIWEIPIVPKPCRDEAGSLQHPDGSGPFRYDYRVGDREIGLKANEQDRRGRPTIDRIVFHCVTDSETSWARLLRGETDIALALTPKDRAMMESYQDRFIFKTRALPCYHILLYNNSDPLFQSPRVRWALTHAINRQYLVKEIMQGFAEMAESIIWPHSPFSSSKVPPIAYDPQRAIELLREEGWVRQPNGCLARAGKCFEFTLFLFEGYQQHRKVGEYLQLCLNDLGIKMQLEAIPHDRLLAKYQRNDRFQAVLTEFKGIDIDLPFAQKLWSGSGETPAIVGGFADPEVTRLFHEAVREYDLTRQTALVQGAAARIIALQPGTFLYYLTATDVMSKRIRVAPNLILDQTNLLAIAFADFE